MNAFNIVTPTYIWLIKSKNQQKTKNEKRLVNLRKVNLHPFEQYEESICSRSYLIEIV